MKKIISWLLDKVILNGLISKTKASVGLVISQILMLLGFRKNGIVLTSKNKSNMRYVLNSLDFSKTVLCASLVGSAVLSGVSSASLFWVVLIAAFYFLMLKWSILYYQKQVI